MRRSVSQDTIGRKHSSTHLCRVFPYKKRQANHRWLLQGRHGNRRVTQNTLGFVNNMGHGHTYWAKATQQSSFVTQRSPQSKTYTGFGLHKEPRTRLHQGTYNSIVGLPLYPASNTFSRCARVFKGSGRHSVIVGLLHQPFDHHQRVATFRT